MKENQMDITLKQAEIESAVRTYVAEKIGINLTGKNLRLNFSMGRGAGNLSAFLAIEYASESQVPGYTDRDADQLQSAEVVNLPTSAAPGQGDTPAADVTETEKTVPTDTVETTDEPVKVEEKTDAKPATTGGIFG